MARSQSTRSNTHCLAERLTRLMHEHGVTTAQLAKETGIAIGTINRMANDKSCNPTMSSLKPICTFFSITVSQIIGEDEIHNFHKPTVKWSTLPIISWRDLKEGSNEQNPQIKINNALGIQAFATNMPDDSMAPFFPKGSILIFDPEQDPCDRGYVLAYLHEHNSYVFKQLIIDKPYQYLRSAHSKVDSYIKLGDKDRIIAPLVQSKINF